MVVGTYIHYCEKWIQKSCDEYIKSLAYDNHDIRLYQVFINILSEP